MGAKWFIQRRAEFFMTYMGAFLYYPVQLWTFMSTLWTRKIGGKNFCVYVYVYGYKVCLHVYKNCVNVAALFIWPDRIKHVLGFYSTSGAILKLCFQIRGRELTVVARLRLPRLHNFCKRVNAPCNRKRKRKRGHFYLPILRVHNVLMWGQMCNG